MKGSMNRGLLLQMVALGMMPGRGEIGSISPPIPTPAPAFIQRTNGGGGRKPKGHRGSVAKQKRAAKKRANIRAHSSKRKAA